ncbi:hypothetical protein M0R45_011052 [Rubus argutus]|uniref:Uncharacterized protein n=1 Tax=Rubus argutus TaxID=59490 RepID=A0AAW1YCK6_RUBAR
MTVCAYLGLYRREWGVWRIWREERDNSVFQSKHQKQLHQTSHLPSTLPTRGKISVHDKAKFIMLLAATTLDSRDGVQAEDILRQLRVPSWIGHASGGCE